MTTILQFMLNWWKETQAWQSKLWRFETVAAESAEVAEVTPSDLGVWLT